MKVTDKLSNWIEETTPKTPEAAKKRRRTIKIISAVCAGMAVTMGIFNTAKDDGNKDPMTFGEDLSYCSGELTIAEGSNLRQDPHTRIDELGPSAMTVPEDFTVSLDRGEWFSVAGYSGDKNGDWVGVSRETLLESAPELSQNYAIVGDADGIIWNNLTQTDSTLTIVECPENQ